jgi:hypothetical protein
LAKRKKTQDELQMQFFKEQIKLKEHYICFLPEIKPAL